MKSWPVQDAKAKFSEMLDDCLTKGPQTVTRRGEKAAVLVSAEEWEAITRTRKPTLKEWLLAPHPKADLEIPPRGRFRRRPIPKLD
jgi:antitoxin Phd